LGTRIRGYTVRQSETQGQSLDFCIATLDGPDVQALPIRIYKLGLRETLVHAGLGKATQPPSSGIRGWENNRWEVGYRLDIGSSWVPGIYVARMGNAGDDSADVHFVVRNGNPGSTTPIVVQIPTATINAYNNWGGASLYSYNSYPKPVSVVSFNRPQYADSNWNRGYGFEDEWVARIETFVRWLEGAGYAADFITNNDLHEDPSLLQNYQLFISAGHDEYWSRSMRDHFDTFIAGGGNAAILGGNTCYWQARFEPDEATGAGGRRLVCYKDSDADPVADRRLKTIRWRDTGDPENRSFGAGGARGAWRGRGRKAAFKVCRPEHWVFHQTELRANDVFEGNDDESILKYETNGVDYTLDAHGKPVPTGSDCTHSNYLILALADVSDWETPGNAALGILANPGSGGTIFNAATTDWACGLAGCVSSGNLFRTATAKITRNVIERLSSPRSPQTNRA
jgi:hypothetical protein